MAGHLDFARLLRGRHGAERTSARRGCVAPRGAAFFQAALRCATRGAWMNTWHHMHPPSLTGTLPPSHARVRLPTPFFLPHASHLLLSSSYPPHLPTQSTTAYLWAAYLLEKLLETHALENRIAVCPPERGAAGKAPPHPTSVGALHNIAT